MMGQTTQGTTREVDIPLAPRREDRHLCSGFPSPWFEPWGFQFATGTIGFARAHFF